MSEYDPFDLEGNQQAKEESEKQAHHKYVVESEDLKWIMSNKRGRRYIWKILSLARIYKSSFTANSNATAFNEGMRNIGLAIVGDIKSYAPEQYDLMSKENRENG